VEYFFRAGMVTLKAKMESNRWEADVVFPVKNFCNVKI
jgi:hypothetical protein